jgi:hypothetical protein
MNEQPPAPYLSSAACFTAGGIAGAGLRLLLAPQFGKAAHQSMPSEEGRLRLRTRAPNQVATRGEEAWDEGWRRQ